MKTVFFGTPAIAVPFLQRLTNRTSVAAVVTSPDEPAGRGYELKAPPVKEEALRLGLPVIQPEKAKDPAFIVRLKELQADVGIVVAYGKLVPREVFEAPRYGLLNVHFSVLPAYRGAAPIQWALINGETETGVTLFWLDEGMDTGPIFLQRKLVVEGDDADGLRNKLVSLGVEMLEEALGLLEKGQKIAVPQNGTPSRAPILKKEDGHLDWTQSARALHNRIRGTTPWPGAFTLVKHGEQRARLKILQARPLSEDAPGIPSTIVRVDGGKGVVIKCGQDLLEIVEVQPEGKKAMGAWSWWQGARLKIGDRLDSL